MDWKTITSHNIYRTRWVFIVNKRGLFRQMHMQQQQNNWQREMTNKRTLCYAGPTTIQFYTPRYTLMKEDTHIEDISSVTH